LTKKKRKCSEQQKNFKKKKLYTYKGKGGERVGPPDARRNSCDLDEKGDSENSASGLNDLIKGDRFFSGLISTYTRNKSFLVRGPEKEGWCAIPDDYWDGKKPERENLKKTLVRMRSARMKRKGYRIFQEIGNVEA